MKRVQRSSQKHQSSDHKEYKHPPIHALKMLDEIPQKHTIKTQTLALLFQNQKKSGGLKCRNKVRRHLAYNIIQKTPAQNRIKINENKRFQYTQGRMYQENNSTEKCPLLVNL